MKERYWTNLVSSLKHGQCILVLGPEVPAQLSVGGSDIVGSPPLTYSEALQRKLSGELEEEGFRVTATSLSGVAQQYADTEAFGPSALRTQAAEFYARTPRALSAAHETVASLPFPLTISTCYDGLLADALSQAGKSPVSYHYNLRGDRRDNAEFAIPGSSSAPLIYHLFGIFEDPQSLVVSEDDLLDFLISIAAERPPMPNCLRRALQRPGTSLLFVGFGIRHWYLRVLLKALMRCFSLGRTGSAVALEPLLHHVPDFDRQQTVLFYQRGTRIEVCDDNIESFLGELQRRLDVEGGTVSQSTPYGSRPRVFLSYANEDHVLGARLFALLREADFDPWFDKDALRGGENWDLMIENQLRETDYVLVLQTLALASKRVGYVNKEIAIARNQAQRYRGSFLIPVAVDDLAPEQRIEELDGYQNMPLRKETFDQDFGTIVSCLRRDYQRRQRQ